MAQRFVHFFPLTCKTDLFSVNTCCARGTQVCVGDQSRAVKSSQRHWMYSAALPATKRCRRLIFTELLRENVEKWSLDATRLQKLVFNIDSVHYSRLVKTCMK